MKTIVGVQGIDVCIHVVLRVFFETLTSFSVIWEVFVCGRIHSTLS